MLPGRSETAVFRTHSERETIEFGERLGRRIRSGVCLSLEGGMGSGKSVLVRGICRGLGVDDDVVSPSFILCEAYMGRLPVIHTDFYRLEFENEIEELGVFDYIDGTTVVIAEWGGRSKRWQDLADAVLELTITGESDRRIGVSYSADVADIFEER